MRFVQTIEFQGTQEEFEASLQRYLEMMQGESTARRATLLADREQPGRFIEIIEFDSYDDAVANSNHPTTQQWAAEAQSLLSQATFRNLDVVGEYTM
jgi:quinol monooxygenase YgiN